MSTSDSILGDICVPSATFRNIVGQAKDEPFNAGHAIVSLTISIYAHCKKEGQRSFIGIGLFQQLNNRQI